MKKTTLVLLLSFTAFALIAFSLAFLNVIMVEYFKEKGICVTPQVHQKAIIEKCNPQV
jgi:hypothetical protein